MKFKNKIHDTSLKSKLIFNTIIILSLALGFNAMLTLNSLEKAYVESIISRYTLVGNDLKRELDCCTLSDF